MGFPTRQDNNLVEPSEPVSGPPSSVAGSLFSAAVEQTNVDCRPKFEPPGWLLDPPKTHQQRIGAPQLRRPFPCRPRTACANRPGPSIRARAGSGSGIPLLLDCSKTPGTAPGLQTNLGPYLTIHGDTEVPTSDAGLACLLQKGLRPQPPQQSRFMNHRESGWQSSVTLSRLLSCSPCSETFRNTEHARHGHAIRQSMAHTSLTRRGTPTLSAVRASLGPASSRRPMAMPAGKCSGMAHTPPSGLPPDR